MIAADVVMHGFVSPSLSRLCALLAERQTARPRELHVLHDGEHVLTAVDTADGPVRELPTTLDTQALRATYGVDRVVVADAGQVRAMVAAVESRVTAAWPQTDVLVALQRGFRECVGVVSDPPMAPVDGWERLRALLRDVGEGAFVLAAGNDAGEWPVALTGWIDGGVIVEVTDLSPIRIAQLPDVDDTTAIALVTTLGALEDALGADDIATAVADLVTVPTRRPA